MGFLAFLLAIALIVVSVKLSRKRKKVEKENERLTQVAREAQELAQRLSKYQEIEDVQAHVQQLRQQASKLVDDANSMAVRIVEDANRKAEEIAGSALDAKQNADHYTQTAKAMRNVVEGYGDEYLVPNQSILEDLAEEYGFKEAGVELKAACERTKQMVKTEKAAYCDYKEKVRRTTAIHFVLDAFNGKVDAILAKTKHDNFGKLEQKIKDAFNLVNQNGQAFKDARIRPEYLEARLKELHWAVAVNELKLKDREEQRRIREQLREEEKVRREIEKARKEAEKEEKMLAAAMAKAMKQLEAASSEERAKYEAEIERIKQQRDVAIEKNQRALSMAQQTRRGHVYVISNVGSFGEDVYKIGMTRRLEPLDRVKELGDASVPFEFDVHAMLNSDDAPALESGLQRYFEKKQVNRVNPRKEFFRVGLQDVRAVVEEMGLSAKWTMKAEAKEYRETLSIVRAEQGISVPQSDIRSSSIPPAPSPERASQI